MKNINTINMTDNEIFYRISGHVPCEVEKLLNEITVKKEDRYIIDTSVFSNISAQVGLDEILLCKNQKGYTNGKCGDTIFFRWVGDSGYSLMAFMFHGGRWNFHSAKEVINDYIARRNNTMEIITETVYSV